MGNTRGNRSIDRILSNLFDYTSDCGTVPPLEPDLPDEGAPSDHRIAFLTCKIPKVKKFKWLKYSYRYLNDESVEKFKEWVVLEDWRSVLEENTSQGKATAYQSTVNAAVERCFPLITVKRKNTDPPLG